METYVPKPMYSGTGVDPRAAAYYQQMALRDEQLRRQMLQTSVRGPSNYYAIMGQAPPQLQRMNQTGMGRMDLGNTLNPGYMATLPPQTQVALMQQAAQVTQASARGLPIPGQSPTPSQIERGRMANLAMRRA